MTPIDQAEHIAQSQFVWSILFIIFFFIIIRYLIKTSDIREKKLIEFYESEKKESRAREKIYHTNLEKLANALGDITNSVGAIQMEMIRMNSRMNFIENGKYNTKKEKENYKHE